MATRFCSKCGGVDFCLTCGTAEQRYRDRTAFHARVMLDVATTAESKAYWAGRLAWADAPLAQAA